MRGVARDDITRSSSTFQPSRLKSGARRAPQLVVDRDLAVNKPGPRKDRLELVHQLDCRHFGAEINGKVVPRRTQGQAGSAWAEDQAVRRRHDLLHEPLIEAAGELDGPFHSPSLCCSVIMEISAMSRRKKRAMMRIGDNRAAFARASESGTGGTSESPTRRSTRAGGCAPEAPRQPLKRQSISHLAEHAESIGLRRAGQVAHEPASLA